MEIRPKNENWYIVKNPGQKAADYIRRSVPQAHRYYSSDDGGWLVYKAHIQNVAKLGQATFVPMAVEEDPYVILHLRPDAPPAIVKAVWREMAKSLHPDRGGDPEQFKRVQAAYEKIISTKV